MNELFMIAGPAGSGKTTLGVALAKRLAAPHLDLDEVTGDLVGRYLDAHPEHDEPSALLTLREARYAELGAAARAVLTTTTGRDVVVIAPFTAEISSVSRWEQWLQAVGARIDDAHLVWLTLPPAERLERMKARGASRDATAVADAGAMEGLPAARTPVVPCLALDALLPTAEQVETVLQRFGNGSSPLWTCPPPPGRFLGVDIDYRHRLLTTITGSEVAP